MKFLSNSVSLRRLGALLFLGLLLCNPLRAANGDPLYDNDFQHRYSFEGGCFAYIIEDKLLDAIMGKTHRFDALAQEMSRVIYKKMNEGYKTGPGELGFLDNQFIFLHISRVHALNQEMKDFLSTVFDEALENLNERHPNTPESPLLAPKNPRVILILQQMDINPAAGELIRLELFVDWNPAGGIYTPMGLMLEGKVL